MERRGKEAMSCSAREPEEVFGRITDWSLLVTCGVCRYREAG